MPELPPDVLRTLLATALAAEGNSLAAWLRLSLVSRGWRDALAGACQEPVPYAACTLKGSHHVVCSRHRRQRVRIAAELHFADKAGMRTAYADMRACALHLNAAMTLNV